MTTLLVISKLFGSLCSGALLGLGPLFYGKRLGQHKLSKIGFIWCLVAGFCGGIYLAILTAILYIYMLYQKSRKPFQSSIETNQPVTIWEGLQAIRPWMVITAIAMTQVIVSFISAKHLNYLVPANLIMSYLLAYLIYLRCTFLEVTVDDLFSGTPKDFNWFTLWIVLSLTILFSLGCVYYYLPSPTLAPWNTLFTPTMGINLVTVAIFAPITEEFLFRGILLHHFGLRWGVNKGIVLCSLVFMAIHFKFNVIAFPILVLGLITSVLFLNTGTLRTPVIFHSLYNAFICVLTFLYQKGHITILKETAPWMLASSILGIAYFLFIYWPRKVCLPWVSTDQERPASYSQPIRHDSAG